MKSSLLVTIHHRGSVNVCDSSGSSISDSKRFGNNNGFDRKSSQVEYSVLQVECQPRGSDEIVERLRLYAVYPHLL